MHLQFRILLLYFILSIQSVFGQQFYCKNYTINEGLPDNTIQDLYQDSRGFLWIGTKSGLARFDGSHFHIYTSQDGLAGDNISSITEGDDGTMWVGFFDGGVSNIFGDKIKSYQNDVFKSLTKIRKIHYSKKYKFLLIGTENELIIFKNHVFSTVSEKISSVKQKLQVSDFLEENDHILIFTNGNGLFKLNSHSIILTRVAPDNPIHVNFIKSAYISSIGDTLINFQKSNFKVLSNNNTIQNDSLGHITDYKEGNDSSVWISSYNTNYSIPGKLFKYKNATLEDYTKYLNINSKNISCLEFDPKEKTLWIGTDNQGLYFYPEDNFTYYNSNDLRTENADIIDLQTDSLKNLWICTKRDLIVKSKDNKINTIVFNQFVDEFIKFKRHQIKNKYSYLNDANGSYDKYEKLIENGKYPYPNPYVTYKNNRREIIADKSLYKPLKYDILINKNLQELNGIEIDPKGNIWVGSNIGIFKIDKLTLSIKYFDLEGTSFRNFSWSPDGKVYAANWSELFIYTDIENNSSYVYHNFYEDGSPINVSKIKFQKDKVFFTSWDHGLFVLDKGSFNSTFNQKSIQYQSFNDLCFDSYGHIILGGNDGVVYITEYSNDSIVHKIEIGKKQGLLGSSIRFLCCIENNQLLIGTNAGINILNLKELYLTGTVQIKAMHKSNGYLDYTGNICILDNSQIWIGTQNRLIHFTSNTLLKLENNSIKFLINSIEINDKVIDFTNSDLFDAWTKIPRSTIHLPFYKNSISVFYDIIQFTDPEDIKLSYKLEGGRNEWTEGSEDRRAIFQNLPPGKYRLRIKASSINLNTFTQELSISFTIAKPIWAKWWFILICAVLILFSIWLLIYIRTRTIQKKERLRLELSERITEFEMKALRSQMNPHFIFNAINSIQNYMLGNDVDTALNYLSDFAKLIRLTLDNVSKKQISLSDELNYLKYYVSLEQMRFDKKFEIEIILPKENENRRILIPPMIIQPFVENAIKHGFIKNQADALIKLKFEVSEEDILKCIVEDNGIGRKKSRELNRNSKTHQSKGTFITNERFALLNQTKSRKLYKINTVDLYDDYNNSRGTRVEIDIPL